LVSHAVREIILEDAEDIEGFEVREDEDVVSYEEMLNRLKENGRL